MGGSTLLLLLRYGGSDASLFLAEDILGAIVAVLKADATVASYCGTRVWSGDVPTGVRPNPIQDPATGRMLPFVVVRELWTVHHWLTGSGYEDDVMVEVDAATAGDPDGARDIGNAVRKALSPGAGTPLIFQDGTEIVRLPQRSQMVRDPSAGLGGQMIWRQLNTVRFMVNRSLS